MAMERLPKLCVFETYTIRTYILWTSRSLLKLHRRQTWQRSSCRPMRHNITMWEELQKQLPNQFYTLGVLFGPSRILYHGQARHVQGAS